MTDNPINIFLVGLPASGKTTLGKELAEKLGLKFIDLDQLIEQEVEMSIPEYFKFQGEANFRLKEKEALADVCSNQENFVLSTGGGTPCFHYNMDTMKRKGKVIYLDVNPGDLALRILEEGVEERPIFKSYDQTDLIEEIRSLREKRESFYQQADIKIRDNRLTAEKIISNLGLGS